MAFLTATCRSRLHPPAGAVVLLVGASLLLQACGGGSLAGVAAGPAAAGAVEPPVSAGAGAPFDAPAVTVPSGPVERIGGPAELPAGAVERVEVAYFHRAKRCRACLEVERLTREVVADGFAAEAADGRLLLLVENTEQPAVPALVQRYDAWGSALYLGVTKAGITYAWRVDDVWFYVNEEPQFVNVLTRGIRSALGQEG